MPSSQPPTKKAEIDRLMTQISSAARFIQNLVARGQKEVVRGELLSLGPIAAPVLIELSGRMDENERRKLQEYLVKVLLTDDLPRTKSTRSLGRLSVLFGKMQPTTGRSDIQEP